MLWLIIIKGNGSYEKIQNFSSISLIYHASSKKRPHGQTWTTWGVNTTGHRYSEGR